MTNNFTALQENQASERFNLIRIESARLLNPFLNGTGYTVLACAFSGIPIEIKENGVTLTKVTGNTPDYGEWSFDGIEIRVRRFFDATPPANETLLVCTHYVFLTSGKNRVWHQDPENTSTDLRDWEPLIIRNTSQNQTIENVIQGKLSFSSSGIEIINDSFQWLTKNDSFYKKNIEIWTCIDSEENIKKTFKGIIDSVSYDRDTIKFTVKDLLNVLDATCLMGDSVNYAYCKKDFFPNIDTNKDGVAIPFIIGKSSRYQLRPGLPNELVVMQDTLYEATCISYNETLSTSVNRTWVTHRANSIHDPSFTVLSLTNPYPNVTHLSVTQATIDKLFVGDSFYTYSTNPAIPKEYGVIMSMNRSLNEVYVSKLTTTLSTDNFAMCALPVVTVIDGESEYRTKFYRDYKISTEATDGSNYLFKIVFEKNFEANVGCPTLSPSQMQVKFRASTDNDFSRQAYLLKELIQRAGLSVDATSVSDSQTNVNEYCQFSIPQFDETDFGSYYNYIQKILESTLGFIRIGSDFEIELGNFLTPSSTNEITESDYIENSLSYDIETRDMVSDLIAYNPHCDSSEDSLNTSQSRSSDKAKYLHGVSNVDRFRHVLQDMTNMIDNHIAVRGAALRKASVDTSVKNLQTILGEQFLLKGESLVTLEVEKSPDKSKLILCDMGDL